MLLNIGFFADRLRSKRILTGVKAGKTPFNLPGFQGECPQLVTIPVSFIWPGALVQNNGFLAQQHKPLAMNGLP